MGHKLRSVSFVGQETKEDKNNREGQGQWWRD